MSVEDIEKLKARFEKDPNSKLFLPLAEEYRKEGMYDEAIGILQEGLEKHPTYTSARVLLAKVYIEKGQLDRARTELEQVIDSVPDNLFAQRKLAEIYRDMGLTEKAIEHYERVVELNPLDDEAIEILGQLKGETAEAPAEVSEGVHEEEGPQLEAEEVTEESKDVEEEPQELEVLEESLREEPVAPEESFVMPQEIPRKDETGDEAMALDMQSPGFSFPSTEEEEEDVAAPDEAEGLMMEQQKEEEQSELSDAFEDYQEFARFINEDIHEIEETGDEITLKEEAEESMFAAAETVPGDTSQEDVSGIQVRERDFFQFPDTSVEIESLLTEADGFVQDEEYARALDIYMEILERDPENKKAKQRVEELKQFLKLIGKDSEVVVARLENFLEGLRRRRDEFFGSP